MTYLNTPNRDQQVCAKQEREIILVDSRCDEKLKDIVLNCQRLLKGFHFTEMKIKVLSLFVSNCMGGTNVNSLSSNWTSVSLANNSIHEWKQKQKTNVVPIGEIMFGVCRHRAILFKYLADRLNIPCRLVRGDYADGEGHAWNVVSFKGTWYLVDVMHYPSELYEKDSPQAQKYKRIGQERDEFFYAGGLGGSTIPFSHPQKRSMAIPQLETAALELYEEIGRGEHQENVGINYNIFFFLCPKKRFFCYCLSMQV